MEVLNKPESMEAREWFIKKLSVQMNIPQSIVSKVVAHNYESIYEAFNSHDSIEVAGFGNFYFNKKKALEQIERYKKQVGEHKIMSENEKLSEKRREAYRHRTTVITNNLNTLLKRTK